eukprot:TRINITY_DN20806_c0_g1_i1.p1 TRINITY_DN20806_c0_g1~~TRINITY_DN20806_c0_g1_i1.p1  ORF type:complete len:113 (+),score=66.22 TRINITY_DN20806_c0_g1_i1:37-375(+)
MIRGPPRSEQSRSSAASDVYKRQGINAEYGEPGECIVFKVFDSSEEPDCARFSLHAAFEDPSAEQGAPERESVELRCIVLLGELPEAVSYTHLRAHETVLDLVCRLLLEKKK